MAFGTEVVSRHQLFRVVRKGVAESKSTNLYSHPKALHRANLRNIDNNGTDKTVYTKRERRLDRQHAERVIGLRGLILLSNKRIVYVYARETRVKEKGERMKGNTNGSPRATTLLDKRMPFCWLVFSIGPVALLLSFDAKSIHNGDNTPRANRA